MGCLVMKGDIENTGLLAFRRCIGAVCIVENSDKSIDEMCKLVEGFADMCSRNSITSSFVVCHLSVFSLKTSRKLHQKLRKLFKFVTIVRYPEFCYEDFLETFNYFEPPPMKDEKQTSSTLTFPSKLSTRKDIATVCSYDAAYVVSGVLHNPTQKNSLISIKTKEYNVKYCVQVIQRVAGVEILYDDRRRKRGEKDEIQQPEANAANTDNNSHNQLKAKSFTAWVEENANYFRDLEEPELTTEMSRAESKQINESVMAQINKICPDVDTRNFITSRIHSIEHMRRRSRSEFMALEQRANSVGFDTDGLPDTPEARSVRLRKCQSSLASSEDSGVNISSKVSSKSSSMQTLPAPKVGTCSSGRQPVGRSMRYPTTTCGGNSGISTIHSSSAGTHTMMHAHQESRGRSRPPPPQL
eukprot:CAMPEP_0197528954 /NCGR_PEP_ID=MMETSP1318-20131121/26870_1 /TAXON_ID=552666 /ORGANISM="Partenskyella glossopodia, Strain RCC365" /LENGTH=412 /DNA_ID=CAMNT_0043084255 /DNA_START=195 /DNA_END=1433 /DNA_ORIENTATION=+